MPENAVFPSPEVPSGIKVQYAEGMGELTEAAVKRLLKKIRKGTCKRVYLALDPDGESSYLEMLSENRHAFLVIGEEWLDGNTVRWRFYTSCDVRFAGSGEAAPIRAGQDVILKCDTIQDLELAAKCVEWYIRTGMPYPGMEWMRGGS